MLKFTHGRSARLAGAALAAMIAAGGLAATAQAQSKPEASEPKRERVEIRRIVKDGKVVEETGVPSDLRAKMGQCDGEKFEAQADGDKKVKNKVFVCVKKGANPAATASILEKTLRDLESESDLRGGGKEQILAQLRARIAELRAR